MLNKLKSKKGFTLIELIMVIVILAVLGAVAIPTYVDLSEEANEAAELGVVGGVRAGLATYFVDPTRGNRGLNGTGYPTELDAGATGVACNTTACFTNVLTQGGVTESTWVRGGAADTYVGPDGTTYTYTSATGSFV